MGDRFCHGCQMGVGWVSKTLLVSRASKIWRITVRRFRWFLSNSTCRNKQLGLSDGCRMDVRWVSDGCRMPCLPALGVVLLPHIAGIGDLLLEYVIWNNHPHSLAHLQREAPMGAQRSPNGSSISRQWELVYSMGVRYAREEIEACDVVARASLV